MRIVLACILTIVITASAGAQLPSAVANPSLPAALAQFSSGGSIGTGTYTAEITFNGSAGGETQVGSNPTPAGRSDYTTTISSGSSNQLLCSAQEAPPGATSFNCYIQLNNTGTFWKQPVCNATLLGSICQITTYSTGTSGPPATNTATSQIATAQNDLGGAGQLVIPAWTGLFNSAGVSGDPGDEQLFVDNRAGTLLSRINGNNVNGQPCKTSEYGPVLCAWQLDWRMNTLQTGQQAQGLTSIMHVGDNPFTPFYGGGINPNNPSAVVAGYILSDGP